jgi:hypothetical protein
MPRKIPASYLQGNQWSNPLNIKVAHPSNANETAWIKEKEDFVKQLQHNHAIPSLKCKAQQFSQKEVYIEPNSNHRQHLPRRHENQHV